MTLIEEETLADHAINVRSIRQELRLLEEQLHGRNEPQHTPTVTADPDTISRQAAIDALDKHLQTTDVPVSYPGIISALTEWLNELPSAQADVPDTNVGDTISRQAAIAIAKDLLIHLEEYHQYNQAINNYCAEIIKLPSAQPEPCEDCVSRKVIMRHYDSGEYKHVNHISRNGLLDYIEQLPSAQPIRCKDCRWRDDYGHWLGCPVLNTDDDNFCSMAERRTDDTD